MAVVIRKGGVFVASVLSNGWALTPVRVPLYEHDCDGSFQSGWAWGVKIVSREGAVISDGRTGVFGSREGVERLILSMEPESVPA